MKKLGFLIICLVLFAQSCKKGQAEFTLKGVITDATFNQGLSGATIKLYQVPVASAQQILVESSTVNSDGSYSFSFPRDKMEKYVIKVSKTNYFDLEEEIFFSELSIKDDNVKNYSTTAKSWVRLRFVNSAPTPSDHMGYIKQSGKEDCAECCPKTEQNYYGALDTAIYCINDGNTTYSYLYWITGGPSGTKSCTTTAFDTTEILLNY